MKLRRKLTWNLFFLFAVIVTLAVVGSYYLSLLASVSTEVTTDNYRTLSYMQEMNATLARLDYKLTEDAEVSISAEEIGRDLDSLDMWLGRQEKNVTEPGESNLTSQLRKGIDHFGQLILSGRNAEGFSPDTIPAEVREKAHRLVPAIYATLGNIHRLNSAAVLRKNRRATATSHDVILSMSIFGTAGVIIGWLFAITLPSVIFKSIDELNDALAEVTAGNYNLKLPTPPGNEFGKLAETFNRMAGKLKEYEQTNVASILSEKQRLDAMINRMSEGVIGLGTDRRIIFANDIAFRLLDIRREDVIGTYAPDLAAHNMLFAEILGRAQGTERGEEGERGYLKIVTDNRERLYAQTVLPLPVETFGEEIELNEQVIMLTDITEFAEKDSAKTKLIATLSHELKTPTAVIDMCADLMSNPKVGRLNGEQEEYLATIRGNTLRIRRLIADMTDLTRAESGVIDMRIEPVQPALLIEKSVEGVAMLMQEKKIRPEIHVDNDLPLIEADFNKGIWGLNNLLTNAIRHSPEGSVITISAERSRSGVTISVSDQGAGLPPEARGQLFERYTRFGDDSAEGSGLGLAIVKEFMERMGGSVDIESQVGQGSRFSLTFRIST